MKFSISILMLAVIFCGSSVYAGFFTGEKLLPLCENGSASKKRACEMYLVGIADAHDGLKRLGGLNGEYFCLSKGVSLPQIQKIFNEYANENPQYLKLPASRLVIGAFARAFPCK